MNLSVRNAVAADRDAVRKALHAAGLPADGIDSRLDGFFICESGGEFRGAAGLEVHGNDGLLRSVVVVPEIQRHGIGRRLCERVMDHARALGCRAVYLLTVDAAAYFERLGFEVLSRDEAPNGIRQSNEFSALCPADAVLMRKRMET